MIYRFIIIILFTSVFFSYAQDLSITSENIKVYNGIDVETAEAKWSDQSCLSLNNKILYFYRPSTYQAIPIKESTNGFANAFFNDYERVEIPKDTILNYGEFESVNFLKVTKGDSEFLWYGKYPSQQTASNLNTNTKEEEFFFWSLFTFKYDYLPNQAFGLIPGVWECAPAKIESLPFPQKLINSDFYDDESGFAVDLIEKLGASGSAGGTVYPAGP